MNTMNTTDTMNQPATTLLQTAQELPLQPYIVILLKYEFSDGDDPKKFCRVAIVHAPKSRQLEGRIFTFREQPYLALASFEKENLIEALDAGILDAVECAECQEPLLEEVR